jgi:hypothetical protein
MSYSLSWISQLRSWSGRTLMWKIFFGLIILLEDLEVPLFLIWFQM